jgi:hypothetical protein
MGDYTLTTEAVRELYGFGRADHPDVETNAEFDRWLREHDAKVIDSVYTEVRLMPCYGTDPDHMEFDFDYDRTQVLGVIAGLAAALRVGGNPKETTDG